MALTATLLQMRTRARQVTNREQGTSVTDAELTDWINHGIQEVWRLLTTADPDRGTTVTTITTTAGTELYALPSDFISVRGLDYPIGGNNVDIERYEFAERNQLQNSWAAIDAAPCKYCIVRGNVSGTGGMISFRPDPGSASITLHYVAAPTALAADGDNFNGIIGFDDYPVYWAALQIRNKFEEDASIETAVLAKIEARITTEAGRRDRSGKRRIARVRDRRAYVFPLPQ